MPTLDRSLNSMADRFRAAGVDSPRLSARLLHGHVLGLEHHVLTAERDRVLTHAESAALEELAGRRARGCPVALLLGRKEFYGRDFLVNEHTLVPRPETEHLVEAALERLDRNAPLAFADLGTGSGALAVTLALEFPRSRGLALDLSRAALDTARENARRLGAEDRLEFVRADFTKPFAAPASLDLVVANPPYVSEREHAGLSPEVRDFEPSSALVSPDNGLWHLARLIPLAAQALRPGGWLVAEMGAEQGGAVADLLAGSFPHGRVEVLKDLAGLDRVGVARRQGS